MKKNETPKYILLTDHMASHNADDRMILLESNDLVSAMEEANKVIDADENLYLAALYQKTQKRDSEKPGAVNYKKVLVNRTNGWKTLENENKTEIWFYYKPVESYKKVVSLLYMDLRFI